MVRPKIVSAIVIVNYIFAGLAALYAVSQISAVTHGAIPLWIPVFSLIFAIFHAVGATALWKRSENGRRVAIGLAIVDVLLFAFLLALWVEVWIGTAEAFNFEAYTLITLLPGIGFLFPILVFAFFVARLNSPTVRDWFKSQ